MIKYLVSIPSRATVFYVVTAGNENEAIKIAHGLGPPHLCSSCSIDIEIGDLDNDLEATAQIIKGNLWEMNKVKK